VGGGLLCLALSGCASAPRETRATPLAFVTPGVDPGSAQASALPVAPELDRDLDAVLARVARVRGLELRERPGLRAVSRAELVQAALGWLDSRTPEPTRRAEAAWLTALELVPADFSWRVALGALLEGRLQAFYDSDGKQVWLDAALPTSLRRRVLAHELVHVLADQHYALGARLADAGTSSDARSALSAISEGDADVLVRELEALGSLPPDRNTGPSELDTSLVPRVIERSLAAAYVDGQAVVQRIFDAGGWDDVNRLYAAPPTSTRALLAPDFPRARPEAEPPSLLPAAPPAEGWSLAASETLGAQALRVVLEEWAPAAAFELAQAWQLDRLSLFERGRARALLWEIHADPARAAAMANLLLTGLSLGEPSTTPGRASAPSCRAHRDAGVVGLWRRGHSLRFGALSDVSHHDGCRRLARWLERTGGVADEPPTRVRVASSVPPDPTPRER
jgi:hypothetical protein